MERKGRQLDEIPNPTNPVRYPAATPGWLPVGGSLPAGVASAGGCAAIPIIPRPWGWGCRANRAATLIRGNPIRRAPTVIWGGAIRGVCDGRAASPAAAAIRGRPAAPARPGNGVDTGLLALGRALGVGAGALCRPPLCPRRVGARSVAPPTRRLGVGRGPLAPLGAPDLPIATDRPSRLTPLAVADP